MTRKLTGMGIGRRKGNTTYEGASASPASWSNDHINLRAQDECSEELPDTEYQKKKKLSLQTMKKVWKNSKNLRITSSQKQIQQKRSKMKCLGLRHSRKNNQQIGCCRGKKYQKYKITNMRAHNQLNI